MMSNPRQTLDDKINEEIGNGVKCTSIIARRNLDILANTRGMDGDTRIRLLLEAYWSEAFEQGKIAARTEANVIPRSKGDYCPQCNKRVPSQAKGYDFIFCWNCGSKLNRRWKKLINNIQPENKED